MKLSDMIMVSIDDHVIEPPDVFDHHFPERYRDQAPKLVHLDDGSDRWIFQGYEAGHFALGSVATWPKEEWTLDASGYSEMRPACYNVHERVKDMNAGGVLSSMSFPTFAGFGGNHLSRGSDNALTAMAFSAYNDWMIEDWCGAYPGRFIPLAILPLRDPAGMVAEIARVAAKGVTAVSIPETPHVLNPPLPSFYSDYWDPVLAALCDHDMRLCLHIGIVYNAIKLADEAPDFNRTIMSPLLCAATLTDLFSAEIFRRFPDLKVALSEGGIGWIPFYLDKMDRHVVNQSWTGLQVGPPGKTPTDVFRDNVLACFIDDPSALRLRDRIGLGTIAWECDYPHSDSTWPDGPECLHEQLVGAECDDREINAITWENACRFFRFEPFANIPRERATVGALRALAKDVDLATTSKKEYRRRYEAAHAGS
jgi:predicted TIM-barrel fold metal-dependent hydrolase